MAMFLSIDGMFVGNRGCVYFDKIAIYYDFFQNKPLRNMIKKKRLKFNVSYTPTGSPMTDPIISYPNYS